MNRIYSAGLTILLVTLSAGGQEITPEEYLQLVQKNHPFFKKELMKVAIEERNAESYLGGQEWFFSLTPTYSHLGEASAGEIGTEGVDQANVVAGLSLKFRSTGGSVSFSKSSGYTNCRETPLGDTGAYSQGVSVAYVQPLQKNLGGELSLSVSTGLKSSEEKIVDSLDVLNPEINNTLEYSVPTGNVALRAKIEKVEAETRQIHEEKRSIVVELESALRNLYVQIRDMEKTLEMESEQIESAGDRTAEELKLYNQGWSHLTFVIQARDNEQNARLAQANNAALFHSLLLQYKALMEKLLPAIFEYQLHVMTKYKRRRLS
jgi:hypothetical protein